MSEERKKVQVLSVQAEPIDINRCSSLRKLLRVTAYIRRFINNIKSRMTGKGKAVESLEVDEVAQAERLWLSLEIIFIRNYVFFSGATLK